MWIRNQNKTLLIDVTAIGVDAGSNIFSITNNGNVEPFVLASYSTKEKALKVLDMIQSFINNELIRDYMVFQMPQNDEVE